MPAQPSLGAWKEFLSARIQQEQGNDEQALETFDRLLSQYPDNEHFQAARTYALSRLGQNEEAIVSNINRVYTEVGKKLVGSEDKPDVWINELNNLLNQTEATDRSSFASAVSVAW